VVPPVSGVMIVPGKKGFVHAGTVDAPWPSISSVRRVAAGRWARSSSATRSSSRPATRSHPPAGPGDQRNRSGRDPHDIRGHSLTVCVKADLARGLAQPGSAAGRDEIADVGGAPARWPTVRAARPGHRANHPGRGAGRALTALAAAGIASERPDQDMGQIPGSSRAVRLGRARGRDHVCAQRANPLAGSGSAPASRRSAPTVRPPSPPGVSLDEGGHAGRTARQLRPIARGGWSRTTCKRLRSGCGATACNGCSGLRELATNAGATLKLGPLRHRCSRGGAPLP